MTNAVGPRAVFGVIVPSTNTVVEHDYWTAGIPGVAYRAGSMYIPNPVMDDDAGFEALLGQIRAAIDTAVRDALTGSPGSHRTDLRCRRRRPGVTPGEVARSVRRSWYPSEGVRHP